MTRRLVFHPPDLLSRFGRFWSEAAVFIKEKDPKDLPNEDPLKKILEDLSKNLPKYENRLKKILEISSGSGMQALNRKGNFRRPNKEESLGKGTLLHYYIYDEEPKKLGQDASLEGVKGDGDNAKYEYQQWAWINHWDSEFIKAGFEALRTPPVDVLPPIPEAKEPHSS